MKNKYAVIMAGGKGERFWPMSTSSHPKQVLSLIDGKPMLSLAVERLEGLIPADQVIIITSTDLVDPICKAVPQLKRENVIGEPFGRDTAVACALGSAIVKAKDKNAVFCILTADHIMKDIPLFQKTLSRCIDVAASKNELLTIGITPTFASTAFGYIEAGDAIGDDGGVTVRKAKKFIEKPDEPTAQQYIATGNYFWNSGMFIWSVKSFEQALHAYQPGLYEMAQRMTGEYRKPGFSAALEEEYGKLEKISVDYAIMEKADNISMAVGSFGWFDIGSWNSLAKVFESGPDGNIVIGKAETIDSSGNIVVSNERLTALVGVDDIVVVQAENATLVCRKDRAEHVKAMVQLLKEKDCYKDVL